MTCKHYDENTARNSSTLADRLKYAGYKVVWYDNDGGSNGVCDCISFENIDPTAIEFKSLCRDGTCYDEVLLQKLRLKLADAAARKQNTVIFLHLIGSHGPTYFERVPDDRKKSLSPHANAGTSKTAPCPRS